MGEAKRRKLLAASGGNNSVSVDACGWALSNPSTTLELEAWFQKRGIDPSNPGIHDTSEFLRAEAQDPTALNMVARLVEARNYSAEELQLAERKILVAAEAIAHHVALDGRLGQCVVASSVLSRCLDELGVWNYTAKSSLTIRFPIAASFKPQYFYSIDDGQFSAAHAIVVAPPFVVVDLTVRHQHYSSASMANCLPAIAYSTEFRPYRMQAQEIVSPSVAAQLRNSGFASSQIYLEREKAEMLNLMKQLPSRELGYEGARLSYGIVAVGGYQERLGELQGPNSMINGLTPLQIFENDILPKL